MSSVITDKIFDKLFDEKTTMFLQRQDVEDLKNYLYRKQGWIYIAHSKNNDFLKIGRTSKNPLERARTLSSTGVLHDYDILFSLPVFNQFITEKNIHKKLKKYRVAKEFFSLNQQVAIEALHKIQQEEALLLERYFDTDLVMNDIALLEYAMENKK